MAGIIITLTTDMGNSDPYVACIKGAIHSQLQEAHIIDISHEIKPWDILQAAFILKSAYFNFPLGTVHIVGVDTEHDANKPHIAVYYDGHYFIGSDNGVFSLMFDKKWDKLVQLNVSSDSEALTFPTKDIFVKVACHIARGGTLEIIGKEVDAIRQANIGIPATEKNVILGRAIYVDNYGNIIVNINKQMFKDIGNGRSFIIYKGSSQYEIDEIKKSYNDVSEGDLVVLFNGLGFLEIAMNKGNASSLLNFKVGDTLRMYFTS